MMSGTLWSKFFWADWLSDTALRRCSPAARGLWMDMLCVAAQGEPAGYVMLDAQGIGRIGGVGAAQAAALLGELEQAGVFSRDRHGRIYSRRMVRDVRARKSAVKSGRKGGLLSREKERGIFRPSKGPPEGGLADTLAPISQKPRARSQLPDDARPVQAGAGAARLPALARAARALGVDEASLRRRTGWIIFGDMIEDLAAQGCDAERDVWPTIGRLAQRLKETPATPVYFRAAILEARDRRRAAGGPHASGIGEWQDRLDVFAREGAWSSAWGPKPGEAGCLAPAISDQRSAVSSQQSAVSSQQSAVR
jgi:hypothetical protein